MKQRGLFVGCALLLCLAWMPAQAQILYDDFSARHIDPAKWIATPMCETPNAYDCAREVQAGQLRLAVGGYGASDSDQGTTFAESGLRVKVHPEAIDTIRFQFMVTSFGSRACSSNSEAAHPQLLAHGTFFNSGSTANPDEDVVAYFMVERRTDDALRPATSLRVGGFMSTATGFFNNVDLGTLKVGEPAVATLKWDRVNGVVVWRVEKTLTKPQVVEETRPSLQGAGNPPTDPFKSLRVGTFAPNCTTAQSFATMDVRIDNVEIGP